MVLLPVNRPAVCANLKLVLLIHTWHQDVRPVDYVRAHSVRLKVEPDDERPPDPTSDTNPLGIVPIVNYKLAKGWYISNGDMVAQYDWDSGQLYIPIAFRLGKVFVRANHTWNFYGEYQTSAVYKDWPGSAVKNSYRVNVTYTMPVGL